VTVPNKGLSGPEYSARPHVADCEKCAWIGWSMKHHNVDLRLDSQLRPTDARTLSTSVKLVSLRMTSRKTSPSLCWPSRRRAMCQCCGCCPRANTSLIWGLLASVSMRVHRGVGRRTPEASAARRRGAPTWSGSCVGRVSSRRDGGRCVGPLGSGCSPPKGSLRVFCVEVSTGKRGRGVH
jgi:hypothetical protein